MPRRRNPIRHEIRAIRRSARQITVALARLAGLVHRVERESRRGGPAAQGKRRLRITPRRRATLKLQGAYMGFMRQLRPREKARVKAVKERRGFRPAIALARRLAGK